MTQAEIIDGLLITAANLEGMRQPGPLEDAKLCRNSVNEILRLERENAALRDVVEKVARMKVFPDNAANQTTLAAAIKMARDVLAPNMGGPPESLQTRVSGDCGVFTDYSGPDNPTK